MKKNIEISTHFEGAAPQGFFRLSEVLKRIPVCKASWWNGCKSGEYPTPYKISKRSTGWKVEDIHECMKKFPPIIY